MSDASSGKHSMSFSSSFSLCSSEQPRANQNRLPCKVVTGLGADGDDMRQNKDRVTGIRGKRSGSNSEPRGDLTFSPISVILE